MIPCKIDKRDFRRFWVNRRGLPFAEGFHTGVDYSAPVDTPIYAAYDGTVILSTDMMGFGSLHPDTLGGCIIIQHLNQKKEIVYIIYGHLKREKGNGETVKEGDIIGYIAPFKSNGVPLPHLHCSVWNGPTMPTTDVKNGIGYGYIKNEKDKGFYVDPDKYFAENN